MDNTNQNGFQLIEDPTNKNITINNYYYGDDAHISNPNLPLFDKIINTITSRTFLTSAIVISIICLNINEKKSEDTNVLKDILNNVQRLK